MKTRTATTHELEADWITNSKATGRSLGNNRKTLVNEKTPIKQIVATFTLLAFLASAFPGYAGSLDVWHQRTSPVSSDLKAVAFGNGMFVAVAEQNGDVLTSTNGANWNLGSIGVTNIDLEGVSFVNNQFIAVGEKGSIFTSPNGATWTPRISGTMSYLHDVHYANGQYVVVGENGRILTSPNSVAWTPHNTATTNYWKDITYANGLYVAVGYYYPGGTRARIATSPDAVSWTYRVVGSTGPAEAIAFADGKFVVSADNGYIHTSTNGINWEIPQQPNTSWLKDIVRAGDTFVTVGWFGTIQTSTNGSAWKICPTPVLTHLFGVASGNNTVVAVGYDGTILQSDPLVAAAPLITIANPSKSENEFKFRFVGEPGQSYQVHVSTNLIQWWLLQTLVCTNASMPVTDAAPTGAKRFYRIFKP
jgi:photosystem II stability/assembly factor-like uncharacterized protein